MPNGYLPPATRRWNEYDRQATLPIYACILELGWTYLVFMFIVFGIFDGFGFDFEPGFRRGLQFGPEFEVRYIRVCLVQH